MSRGEPISDTAKVLSSMLDAVVIRTTNHELLEIFSKNSSIPVINGLSDLYHPCQILADLMTFKEFQGNLDISKVAWIGDSNNVCNSYIEAAKLLDFNLNIYCPKGYEPNSVVMKSQKNNVVLTENKENALKEAKIVTTDVWTSMHSENQTQEKSKNFDGYSVDPNCMELAHEEAIFLHCLPAHRGEEVSIDMLEHSSSRVWSQAENRLHVQQALLERLLLD
jgi:ornithine carbamoyltransferase